MLRLVYYRWSRTPLAASTNPRPLGPDPSASEITNIIPFNEFGSVAEVNVRGNAFECASKVVSAPELDDLDDTDNQAPARLAAPRAYRESHPDLANANAVTSVIRMDGRRGAHRKDDASTPKGRLMIAAIAAGATTAAIHTVATTHNSPATTAGAVLAAGSTATDAANSSSDGVQVIAVTEPTADVALHSEELAKGAAFAQERADREARLQRPLFVMPTNGVFTSGFGYRWGALHGGIDLANAIGTPIYAAADGVVIDAGPTAGFGAWVKVRHNDGTVTLYGHVNSWLVGVGDRVLAGDQIATIGNRGNSTGPHLHFEVLLNGTDRIDPVGWLAQRGLSPGAYAG
jgi:murein DD-endopeptidase MepM/ murein hydrolase activator NlpD